MEEKMKDAMTYYARCNKAVNASLNEIIRNNIPDPYDLKLDGYFFKTLGDILDHLFVTDMIWMKAFQDVDSCGLDMTAEVRPVPVYGEKVFRNFDEYEIFRNRLDGFILKYMNSINEDLFEKSVSRKTRDGKTMEKKVYKSMIHFFNHQTHHRGQISNILDHMKTENNYSNMIGID
jgi:uncharacterized damage-inducible protein DinB